MSEEVKPCPFCGHKKILQNSGDGYLVSCMKCGSRGSQKKYYETMSDAITAWNTRPIEDEKDKVIARLKGNWDYLKEYLVALRNSRLHDEKLLSSEMNRHEILFLNQLIEKINTADNNVGSMEEEK